MRQTRQKIGLSQRYETQTIDVNTDVKFLKGPPGDKGAPGFSPLIDVVESANGHTVTITDKEGIEQFFVANGESVEEIPISFIEAL